MPEIPDDAVQAAAEVLLRQYESEYSAAHLTWRDFADPARQVLEAAAPVMAEAVAQKILAHMEAHGPQAGTPLGAQSRRAWRRHFRIAAQLATFAFSTEADIKRAAVEAIARGDIVVCHDPHEQKDSGEIPPELAERVLDRLGGPLLPHGDPIGELIPYLARIAGRPA